MCARPYFSCQLRPRKAPSPAQRCGPTGFRVIRSRCGCCLSIFTCLSKRSRLFQSALRQAGRNRSLFVVQLELVAVTGGVGTMAKHIVSEEAKLGGMKIKQNRAKLSDSLCVSLLATAICHWKLGCLWDLRVIHGHYIGKDLSLLNNCLIKTFLSSGSHPFSPNNKSRNQTLLLNWSVHLMIKLFGLCTDTSKNPFHKIKKHRLSYRNHGNFGSLTLPYFSLDIGGAYIFVHLEGSQQFQSTGNIIRQNAL